MSAARLRNELWLCIFIKNEVSNGTILLDDASGYEKDSIQKACFGPELIPRTVKRPDTDQQPIAATVLRKALHGNRKTMYPH